MQRRCSTEVFESPPESVRPVRLDNHSLLPSQHDASLVFDSPRMTTSPWEGWGRILTSVHASRQRRRDSLGQSDEKSAYHGREGHEGGYDEERATAVCDITNNTNLCQGKKRYPCHSIQPKFFFPGDAPSFYVYERRSEISRRPLQQRSGVVEHIAIGGLELSNASLVTRCPQQNAERIGKNNQSPRAPMPRNPSISHSRPVIRQ